MKASDAARAIGCDCSREGNFDSLGYLGQRTPRMLCYLKDERFLPALESELVSAVITSADLVARIKAPVLGLYGAADGGIPNDTVEKMRDALTAAGNTASELVLYPDTPHAFHADYRPSYRKEQADDGWKRCLAWFARHLA